MILYDRHELIKYIFSEYSQIDLFAYFLKITPESIKHCLVARSRCINNPRRNDTRPSLGFLFFKSKYGAKLRMRDWADNTYSGDIFDLVGDIISKDVNKSREFVEVCQYIIQTYTADGLPTTDETEYKEAISDTFEKIDIIPRAFRQSDYDYWRRFGITKEVLEHNRVYCVDYAYLNDKCIYVYKASDVCYGYLEMTIDDVDIWELYFPARKNKKERKSLQDARFITNGKSGLRSTYELTSGDVLILTQSKKSKMAIDSALYRLSPHIFFLWGEGKAVTVINVSSEGITLTDKEIEILYTYYPVIYSNSDFDRTGIRFANTHKRLYGIPPLLLSNGKCGTYNYKAKDFAELVDKHGTTYADELIRSIIGILQPNIYAEL